jgi:hypothetical protein
MVSSENSPRLSGNAPTQASSGVHDSWTGASRTSPSIQEEGEGRPPVLLDGVHFSAVADVTATVPIPHQDLEQILDEWMDWTNAEANVVTVAADSVESAGEPSSRPAAVLEGPSSGASRIHRPEWTDEEADYPAESSRSAALRAAPEGSLEHSDVEMGDANPLSTAAEFGESQPPTLPSADQVSGKGKLRGPQFDDGRGVFPRLYSDNEELPRFGTGTDLWAKRAFQRSYKAENQLLEAQLYEVQTELRQLKELLEKQSVKRKRPVEQVAKERASQRLPKKSRPTIPVTIASSDEDLFPSNSMAIWADSEDEEDLPPATVVHPSWRKLVELKFTGASKDEITPRTYVEHVRLAIEQTGHRLTQAQKRQLFSAGLKDRARAWFDSWMRTKREELGSRSAVARVRYLKFIKEFLTQHERGDPAERVRHRMVEAQYRDLDQWVSEWRELRQESPADVSEKMRVTLFIRQLPSGMKAFLSQDEPKTLDAAIAKAYKYHHQIGKHAERAAGPGKIHQGRAKKRRLEKSTSKVEGMGGKNCFQCGKPGHWSRNCPNKGQKKKKGAEAHKIVVNDHVTSGSSRYNKVDDEIYFDVPTSLHLTNAKLSGAKPEKLLVIEVQLNGMPVLALIDCGATNNYLNEKVVDKIPNLRREKLPRILKVATVAGQRNTQDLVITDSLMVGTFEDTDVGFVVLPMGDKYGAILGMPFFLKNNPRIDWLAPNMLIDRRGVTHYIPITRKSDQNTPSLNHWPAKPESLVTWRKFEVIPEEDELFLAIVNSVEVPSSTTILAEFPEKEKTGCEEQLHRLLDDFKDVFPEVLPKEPTARPGFDHEINLLPGTKPPRIRPYRLSPVELEEVRRNIDEMLEKGYIKPSNSPYSSPLLFVKKKDGTLRMCNDYRALNKITISDAYPLPRIDQLYDTVGKARYFTAIDLRSGYYQIKIVNRDTGKTAFSCRFGIFEYCVMPFGLKNAPATFQRLMNQIFRDLLDKCVLVYLDDILVYSNTIEEHLEHLRLVFTRLREHKLYANLGKCQFWMTELLYLGFRIGGGKIRVDPEKTNKILTMGRPKNRKQVQQYLGFVNYFARFIPNAAKILEPISNLLRGRGKRAVQDFVWTPECEKAFEQTKILLTTAPVLRVPDMSLPFIVTTDASQMAIAGMLSQEFPDGEHPVAYTSRKLSDAEKNYTVYEQEMLAVVHSCTVWRCYVENTKETTVRTDHYSLKYLLATSTPPANRRVARWVQRLQGLNLCIEHKRGIDNKVADALSRLEVHYTVSLQERDETWLEVLKYRIQHLIWPPKAKQSDIEKAERELANFTVDGVELKYKGPGETHWRPFIPKPERANLLYSVHEETGHQAWENTYNLMKRKVYWPAMRQDAKDWLTQCYECRSRKVPGQPQTALHPLRVQDVFRRWHLDNTGPFPESGAGNKYTITACDAASKWFVAKAVPEISARQHAIFIYEELAMQFGYPEEIVTDQGSAFDNEVLKEFLSILHTKYRRTTPYHPRSNGQVERAHKDFHERLAFLVKGMIHKWDLFIPEALWAMRTRVHRVTGYSPYYLVYGIEPRNSLDPIARPFIFDLSDPRDAAEKRARDLEELGKAREAAKERVKLNNAKAVEAFNKRIKSIKEIQVGDLVQIIIPPRQRTKLGPRSKGPYRVIEVKDNNTLKLSDLNATPGNETHYISRDNVALVGITPPLDKKRKEFKGIEIRIPKNPEIRTPRWTPEQLAKENIRMMS